MKAINLLLVIILLLLASCKNNTAPQPEDEVKTVDHHGAIETEVAVTHLNPQTDLLTTTHKVWAFDSLLHTYVTIDTIPALGSMYTVAEAADSSQKIVEVPREYEVYLTVK